MATQRVAEGLPDEDFILRQPLSQRRIEAFFLDFLRERQLTRTTEAMFRYAGALKLLPRPAPEGVVDFGFKIIVFKESFVDGVDTVLVSAQRFATVQENFLLDRLGSALQESVDGRDHESVTVGLPSLLDALDHMTDELSLRGGAPTLYVLAGYIDQVVYDRFTRQLQTPYAWYRDQDERRRAVHSLMGAYNGIPVLNIADGRAPRLYAVDLERFATLMRYGDGPEFLPEFRVYRFTEDEARAALRQQPRLILEPPPESGDETERVRQMLLRATLELWETYEIRVRAPNAVVCRELIEVDGDPNDD